jgi:hypothetical protein
MIVLPGCPSLQTGWPGSVWNGGRDQIGTVAAIKLEYMAGMRWNPQIGKYLILNPAVGFDSRAGFFVRHNQCEQLRLAQGAAADRVDAP